MKKQFFKYILVSVLLSACFYFKAGAQNIQAEAKLQQSTIRIGDQTQLSLMVHQPNDARVNFPRLTDTITGKVLLVSAGKPDTTIDKGGSKYITVAQNYTITCFDAGTYTIPSFAFGSTGGVLKSNELTLRVVTVKVDTAKAIYDIKQPFAVSYTFFDWLRDNWQLVVIPLLVVLLIIGIIWYLKRRPKREPVAEVIKPGLPPHEVAVIKLKELREKKLWQQGEVKQYHSELSDVLREYLEKRYGVKTYEKTTGEIFEGLRNLGIEGENKNILRQILMLADLVKFAKEKPLPAENEQSMDDAVYFVLKTQRVEQPAKEGGGNADV